MPYGRFTTLPIFIRDYSNPKRDTVTKGKLYLQGITIKPLVKILNVKRAERKKPTMNERIHERVRVLFIVFSFYELSSISRFDRSQRVKCNDVFFHDDRSVNRTKGAAERVRRKSAGNRERCINYRGRVVVRPYRWRKY